MLRPGLLRRARARDPEARRRLLKGPVALLTDFGLRDHYVGAMKGVILSRCPAARIVDVSHEVPPQDVRAAAFQLMAAAPYFPKGTLFVAVVDPGVGSERRVLYGESAGRGFLFPDNGVASWVGALAGVRAVTNRKLFLPEVSAVFHGRDIFAPVAAALLRGLAPARLGPAAADLAALDFPEVAGGKASVLAVDRFGNAVTCLKAGMLPAAARLEYKGRRLPLAAHYAAIPRGGAAAVAGSSGLIELCVRDGSFAETFGAGPGDVVAVIEKGE